MHSAFDRNVDNALATWSSLPSHTDPQCTEFWPDSVPVVPLVSPFHGSFLRNEDDQTYVGNEFMIRNHWEDEFDICSLGGEIVPLPFAKYRPAFVVRSADDDNVNVPGTVAHFSHQLMLVSHTTSLHGDTGHLI